MSEAEPAGAATAVRRGVTSLSRRLRMERPEPGEPLLQLSVLAHLNRRGPMTPGELAAAERVQPQSLTRALASLEAAGRILRQPDPDDGRRSRLAIAETGRLALARDMRQRDAWLARAMATHLTPTEQELLRLAGELLERLADVGDLAGAAGGLAATTDLAAATDLTVVADEFPQFST